MTSVLPTQTEDNAACSNACAPPSADGLPDDAHIEVIFEPVSRALGYLYGSLERHAVREPLPLLAMLCVATELRPMDLAQRVAAMLREIHALEPTAAAESGPGWFRLRAADSGYLLALNSELSLLWLSSRHGQRGTLCFCGPLGGAARLVYDVNTDRRASRLTVVGNRRFKSCLRRMLLQQIDLEGVLQTMMQTPFYANAAVGAEEPPHIPDLERAASLAKERGIAEAGPDLFTLEPAGFRDPTTRREHYRRAYRMAHGRQAADHS